MPFETLQTITKDNQPPTAKLSYLRPKDRKTGQSKRDSKPNLKITIASTVCGTSKSELYELLLGTGADAGKIRVKGIDTKRSPKKGHGVKVKQLMHAFVWDFGYVPKLGEDIFEDRCEVTKIGDEEYEIAGKASWFEHVG